MQLPRYHSSALPQQATLSPQLAGAGAAAYGLGQPAKYLAAFFRMSRSSSVRRSWLRSLTTSLFASTARRRLCGGYVNRSDIPQMGDRRPVLAGAV